MNEWTRSAWSVSQYFFENHQNACEIRKVNNNSNNNNCNNTLCGVVIELFQNSPFVCVVGSRFRPPFIPPSWNTLEDIFLANRTPPNVSQPGLSFVLSVLLWASCCSLPQYAWRGFCCNHRNKGETTEVRTLHSEVLRLWRSESDTCSRLRQTLAVKDCAAGWYAREVGFG